MSCFHSDGLATLVVYRWGRWRIPSAHMASYCAHCDAWFGLITRQPKPFIHYAKWCALVRDEIWLSIPVFVSFNFTVQCRVSAAVRVSSVLRFNTRSPRSVAGSSRSQARRCVCKLYVCTVRIIKLTRGIMFSMRSGECTFPGLWLAQAHDPHMRSSWQYTCNHVKNSVVIVCVYVYKRVRTLNFHLIQDVFQCVLSMSGSIYGFGIFKPTFMTTTSNRSHVIDMDGARWQHWVDLRPVCKICAKETVTRLFGNCN